MQNLTHTLVPAARVLAGAVAGLVFFVASVALVGSVFHAMNGPWFLTVLFLGVVLAVMMRRDYVASQRQARRCSQVSQYETSPYSVHRRPAA